MRTNLQVPFAEKDEAKRLGARWDASGRVWYVQNVDDLAAFARWLPGQVAGQAASSPPKPRPVKAARLEAASLVKTGARFFELACDCLPWEGCPKCQPAVQAKAWRVPA